MTGMNRHAREDVSPWRRDYMWVAVIIAAFAMYDVWGAWARIGNESGFAHGTGWTLAVIVESYWAYALYAWLGGSPGKRSRRFAMCSAGGVFLLSLIGQGASHLTEQQLPPTSVVVFVSVLPVTILALIAVLIHLRKLDREEAAEVARESALQAQLDETLAARGAAEAARTEAQREAAEAVAKAEALERKLAAVSRPKRTRKTAAKKAPSSSRNDGETGVPKDVDARAEALAILDAEPGIKGAQLGPRVGKSERWGQMLMKELATVPADPNEEAR